MTDEEANGRKFEYLAKSFTSWTGGDPGLEFRPSDYSLTGRLPCFLYSSGKISPPQ